FHHAVVDADRCLCPPCMTPHASPGSRIFQFYRFGFHFRAAGAVHFPKGKSSNVLRGSFGRLLRDTAPPPVYARLFEPGKALGKGPSELSDWLRPVLFRASHLDDL